MTRFDAIQKSLFTDDEKLVAALSPTDMALRERYMAAFTYWLENPVYTDQQIMLFIRRSFGVAQRTAYKDVSTVKVLLGSVQNAGKEWYRHMTIQMCQEAYALAKKKNDPKAMALAADKLGKYTRCDELDADELPWDQIIPPAFEPSGDISVLGFKPDPDIERKRAKMIRKYSGDIEDAVLLQEG